METIYKYEIALTDSQALSLPADAQILSIQEQGNCLCAWARVDTCKPERDRTIICCGTGNKIEQDSMRFISTVQMGSFVWHFFEL